MKLPDVWKEFLREYLATAWARELYARVEKEYATHRVCPPKDKLFSAFCVAPRDVRVVIIGQDPYFNEGQATGMAFSIDPTCGCKFPPSLSNIIKEVRDEFEKCAVANGDLEPWARQGVLLLNSALTVRLGEPLSHAGIGWTEFVRHVIAKLNELGGIVFLLWGGHAGGFRPMLTNPANLVLQSAHPSPLSASRGFFGNGHFKRANEFLAALGRGEIEW